MDMITQECRDYLMRRDECMRDPSRVCSVIVDGTDKSAFGFSHFITSTEDGKGYSLKVWGVLDHCMFKHTLYLFILREEFETGANHIIEAIYRFINSTITRRNLPKKLYIRMNNCTRENKNRCVFG